MIWSGQRDWNSQGNFTLPNVYKFNLTFGQPMRQYE